MYSSILLRSKIVGQCWFLFTFETSVTQLLETIDFEVVGGLCAKDWTVRIPAVERRWRPSPL